MIPQAILIAALSAGLELGEGGSRPLSENDTLSVKGLLAAPETEAGLRRGRALHDFLPMTSH